MMSRSAASCSSDAFFRVHAVARAQRRRVHAPRRRLRVPRVVHAFICGLLSLSAAGLSPAQDSVPSSSAWEFLRAKYYGDRSMGVVDEGYMSLEVPGNTPDPAATPLSVHFADPAGRRIKRVRVFIDNNPSPLVATFDFAQTPINEIDLHVRIDRFTSVRAVAETADGSLEMRSAWVKASGGCSAPPTQASAGAALGQVKLRPAEDAKSVLVSIRHPNSSGFQIDPRTGDSIPARYISHLRIDAGGKPVLEAETGISLSENPTLRLASDQGLALPLSVDALDSVTHAHYTGSTDSLPGSAATAAARSATGGSDR
jgi:sulfur-oxidizing protein SoxY